MVGITRQCLHGVDLLRMYLYLVLCTVLMNLMCYVQASHFQEVHGELQQQPQWWEGQYPTTIDARDVSLAN